MYGYSEMFGKVVELNQDARLLRVKSAIEPEPFAVRKLKGTETVSNPFEVQVELISTDARIELKEVVGHPLLLSLQTDFGDRHFHGYVKEFARLSTDDGLTNYSATVSPWFSFLDYTSNCRIFQDKTVVEIVEEVFGGYSDFAAYKFVVEESKYRKLPYCVQYNESDFAFVSRLLEDAGIWYHFTHDADEGHRMMLLDDSTRCDEIECRAPVRFHNDEGLLNERCLDLWEARRTVTATVESNKTFDFKSNPKAGSKALSGQRPLEVPRGLLPTFERYTYSGSARFDSTTAGDDLAEIRAQELAWPTKVFQGAGDHRNLAAGRYFVLDGHFEHAEADAGDRSFFVVGVNHEAENNFIADLSRAEGMNYRSRVISLRRKIPFRPQRITQQKPMPGPQTATVVGPPGEEIYEDKYGRVKVQFHWDRQGEFNDKSSCWVRVSNPWAGEGMGGVSAPRIGQEVVVDFLDGDPDRPLIVGRVYNEDNPRPHGGEVSGIKSKTVKGEGYNALTMTDTAGSQSMDLHAQKDMSTMVLNDQTNNIKNNQTTDVTSNQTVTVGADRSKTVKGNETNAVTGNRSNTVKGTQSATVTGAVTETFENGQTLTIPAVGYTETITGPLVTTLTGAYTSNRTGAWNETVTGVSVRSVTAGHTENIQGGRNINVTGAYARSVEGMVDDFNKGARFVTVDGDLEHGVTGTHAAFSTGEMNLGSGAVLKLGVGGSGIEINNGEITITSNGSTVKINAGGVTVNGAKIDLN